MTPREKTSLLALPVILLVAGGLAWAGSYRGVTWRGVPVFALAVGLVFVVNWLAFIPAWLRRTEKFFDLMGGLSSVGLIEHSTAVCDMRYEV